MHISRWPKIRDAVQKAEKFLNWLAIISLFGILLYRIGALRAMCRGVCQYLIDCGAPVGLQAIETGYLRVEICFRWIILAFVAVKFLVFLGRIVWDLWLKQQTGRTRFEQSILRYLHGSNAPRSFLVTGRWGSGKTYEVRDFFDRYYCFSRTKVYRISCFGLTSRQDLIREINSAIEQADDSFYALMIKAMQLLPIIGEPIGKLLKKSYGYDLENKGSVFIFDDFERITSRAVTTPGRSGTYRRTSFLLHRTSTRDRIREFDEINNEFGLVERAFQEIKKSESLLAERVDLDKYVAVIGLINELIEIYGMKVVIICNSDVLGEQFVHEVLRSKLDCLEYRKSVSTPMKAAVIDSVIANNAGDDEEKQASITGYLCRIKALADKLELAPVFDNMRLFSGLLEAFVSTASLFDAAALTDEFMSSLFNSIALVHQLFYNDSASWLSIPDTGASIQFLSRLYGEDGPRPYPVRLGYGAKETGWVNIRFSGRWIFNLSSPGNSGEVYDAWKHYAYYELEEELARTPEALLAAEDYTLQHVLYYEMFLLRQNTEDSWDPEPYIRRALDACDLAEPGTVERILDLCELTLPSVSVRAFLNTLFSVLREKGAGPVAGRAKLYTQYDSYLRDAASTSERPSPAD